MDRNSISLKMSVSRIRLSVMAANILHYNLKFNLTHLSHFYIIDESQIISIKYNTKCNCEGIASYRYYYHFLLKLLRKREK